MDDFNATDGEWEDEDQAGEPADPEGGARSARPEEVEGRWERLKRRVLQPLVPGFLVAALHPRNAADPFTKIHRANVAFVWKKLVWSRIPREDAREIIQEVFLIMHQEMKKGGPPASVRGKLARITLNQICNYRRARRRELIERGIDPGFLPGSQPSTEMLADACQRHGILLALAAKLPDDDGELILLLDVAQFTHEEVAAQRECSLSAAKMAHARARERLVDLGRRLYKKDLGGGS